MVEDTQGWSFCVELSVLKHWGLQDLWAQPGGMATNSSRTQAGLTGGKLSRCRGLPGTFMQQCLIECRWIIPSRNWERQWIRPSWVELVMKISISWKYSLRQIPAIERQSSNWKRTSFAMDNPWQVFLMSWTDVFHWNKSRFIQGKAGINFARSCDSLRSAEIWLREGSLEQIGWGRYWWSGIFKTFELLSTKELYKPVFFLADSQKWREWSNGAISGMYWLIGWLRTGKRCFAKGLQQQGRQGRYSVEISTYFECLQEFFFWTECISV